MLRKLLRFAFGYRCQLCGAQSDDPSTLCRPEKL
jgi:hypothetical protein